MGGNFLILQRIVVVLLFLIAMVIWYKAKRRGALNLFKSRRVMDFSLLITIPILIGFLYFIPGNISVILESGAMFVVLLFLFAELHSVYAHNENMRAKELGELAEEPREHPIKLEFAREIVKPEIAKLERKRKELDSEKEDLNLMNENLDVREE